MIPFFHLIRSSANLICTAVEIVGFGSTVYCVNKAAPKANAIIKDMTAAGASKKEIAKALLPVYTPAITVGSLTIGTMVVHAVLSEKDKALLGTLLGTAEATITAYQDKIIDVVGPEKASEIKAAVAKQTTDHFKLPENPADIVDTGNGTTRIKDGWSGVVYYSDINVVKSAVNKFNDIILTRDTWKELNEFYEMIGIGTANSECGRNVGYNIDQLLEVEPVPIIDTDGKTTVIMSYENRPVTYDGRRL